MKPKAYLVSIGALPPGSENKRGRMSAESIALCEKAVSEGINIDGFSISSNKLVNNSSSETTDEKTVKRVPVSNEKVVAEGVIYRSENEYRAHEIPVGKKKIYRGMREACRNCRCSLVGCPCVTPSIVALDGTKSVNVAFERV